MDLVNIDVCHLTPVENALRSVRGLRFTYAQSSTASVDFACQTGHLFKLPQIGEAPAFAAIADDFETMTSKAWDRVKLISSCSINVDHISHKFADS